MASFANGFNKKFLRDSISTTEGMDTAISRKPFSPPSIQVLAGWWLPDKGITLNAQTISAWANQGTLGGSLAQGTAANQPFFNLSGSTTKYPAITFSGAHYFISDLAASAWTFMHAFSSTTFIVARTNDANPGNQYGFFGTSLKAASTLVPGINFFLDDRTGSGFNDRLGVQVKNNNTSIFDFFGSNGTAKAPTNYQVYEFSILTGSGVSFLIDKTLMAAGLSGSFTGIQYWGAPQFSLYVGLVPGTNFFKGNIQEIMIYSGSLSLEERNVVREYLNKKYDIPGLL